MTEEWRWVVGYWGLYKVSNTGRVLSYAGRGKRSGPQILQGKRNDKGCAYVTLCRSGYQKTISIQRLMAAAFVGGREYRPS
jgi:hypothetical protein